MTYPFWKRCLDVFGASCGLIIVLPLTPIIALSIKLESKGPVLVKLKRVSGGKVVDVYKFRSMIDGAAAMKGGLRHLNERNDGPFFKIKKDPRITKSGRLLRKFRIDEAPQFINVLKGELALVGPRPHEPEEVIHYPDKYKSLLLERSGITGLSQVNGASSLPFMKELELDKFYSDNASFDLDSKIIFKTAAILFFDPTAV